MNNTINIFLVIIGLVLFLYSCDKERGVQKYKINTEDISDVDVTEIQIDIPCSLKLSSNIQSNKSGVYIPCFDPNVDTTLYRVQINDNKVVSLSGVTPNGRGPLEYSNFSYSNLFSNSSLHYHSSSSAKSLIINKDGSLKEIVFDNSRIASTMGQPIVYNGEYFILSTGIFNDEFNLLAFDNDGNEIATIEKKRIPKGYQPKIRDHLSTLAVDDGKLFFSYYGDREIYVYENFNKAKIFTLGENDPIDLVFHKDGDGSKTTPYIGKMVAQDGILYVLYIKKLLIIDTISNKVIRVIDLESIVHKYNESDAFVAVTDFTIYNQRIFFKVNYDEYYLSEVLSF